MFIKPKSVKEIFQDAMGFLDNILDAAQPKAPL